MHHVGNGAYFVYGIEHYYSLRSIRHAYCHAFAFFYSYCRQSSGTFVYFSYKILISRFASHKVICYVIGIVFRYGRNFIVHRPLKIFQMCRHTAKMTYPWCFNIHVFITHILLPPLPEVPEVPDCVKDI